MLEGAEKMMSSDSRATRVEDDDEESIHEPLLAIKNYHSNVYGAKEQNSSSSANNDDLFMHSVLVYFAYNFLLRYKVQSSMFIAIYLYKIIR